jgi:hypothetical protein
MNVHACHQAAATRRSAAEELLRSARTKYADSTKLRDQSLTLAQELRDVAARILESRPESDECPLCHTQFEPGELAKHINVGFDQKTEALGQVLLNEIREQEAAVHGATSVETAAASLMKFCERAGVPGDISIRIALDRATDTERMIVGLRGQAESLNNDLLALESQGLSIGKLEEASAQLRELGYPLAEFSGFGEFIPDA